MAPHWVVDGVEGRGGDANGASAWRTCISPSICCFAGLLVAFMRMLPSGSSQLPGGRHEGVAVKMLVPTLGSPRRTVASAAAPGAVPAWTRFSDGPSKMFIFIRFYRVFASPTGRRKLACFTSKSGDPCASLPADRPYYCESLDI